MVCTANWRPSERKRIGRIRPKIDISRLAGHLADRGQRALRCIRCDAKDNNKKMILKEPPSLDRFLSPLILLITNLSSVSPPFQAQQVGLLTEKHSYLITSLVRHR